MLAVQQLAPVIPPPLRAIVRAQGKCIIVRDLRGRDIRDCPETDGYIITWESFDSYAGGRFIGVSYLQNDISNYDIIDRAGQGPNRVIQTGRAPTFSPNGRAFAVAVTGSYVATLRGIGLWSVRAGGVDPVFFTDAASDLEWEVTSFPRNNCAVLTATSEESAPSDPARPNQPDTTTRTNTSYTLTFDHGVSLASSQTSACPAEDASRR